MIWRYCTTCFRRDGLTAVEGRLWLCELCRDELEELSLPRHRRPLAGPGGDLGGACTSLFRYRGCVRQLILRAKVHGDQPALLLLVALAIRRPEFRLAVARADVLVTGPSSLWGRLRGRLDLAAHLTHRGAADLGRPVLAAPLHLQWRWHKRARVSRAERPAERPAPRWLVEVASRRFDERLARAVPAGSRLLIIDDVVTTGATLAGVGAAVGGEDRIVEYLALADARG